MKLKITSLFFLCAVVLLGLSCTKDDAETDIVQIDEKNLTECPANANCQNIYLENKDFDTVGRLKAGDKRVFSSSISYPGVTSTLYIKVPMYADSFSYGKAEVLNGKISWVSACPACNMIALKAIDGYAKGRKLSGGSGTDLNKWILEGRIIMQAMDNSGYKDTIAVKQYFYQGVTTQ